MMRIVSILLITGLMLGCDTERNIPPLDNDTFLKFYGEEGEQTGVDFVLLPDNTIVMVGNSTRQPTANQMIYVVKVDLIGNVIWENIIGLSDKNHTVKDIELHPDGRLIIAGETEMAPGNRDVFVKILNDSGSELDSIRYGLNRYLASGGDEEVNSITIISQGLTHPAGFIVSGSTTDIPFNALKPDDIKDGLILRLLDSPLTEISISDWRSKGEDNSEDVVVKVIQEDNNTYYGFGYTNRETNTSKDFKYWIFKLNDAGGELNNGVILGLPTEDEKLRTVVDVNTTDLFDKGFLLGGVAVDNSGNKRGFFVKLKRTIVFGTPSAQDAKQVYSFPLGTSAIEKMNGFYNLSNNDFLILSTQNTNIALAEDLSLFKFDREIQPVWGPEAFGGESTDEAGAVLQLPNGKIMIIGTVKVGGLRGQQKMALMKLNDEGKLLR